MKKLPKISTFLLAAVLFAACSDSDNPSSNASNDNEEISSSSMAESSSSEALETFTDSRDGQSYKMVKIGEQTWMAENLNYETSNSYCYLNDTTKCSEFGRYYTWKEAQEACPSGWHLPDTTEWKTLLEAVGGASVAGEKLKSTSMWQFNAGTDDFSFTVLPAGEKGSDGVFYYTKTSREHSNAGFWSSDKSTEDYITDEGTYHHEFYIYLGISEYDKGAYFAAEEYFWFNIRCLKGPRFHPLRQPRMQ